MSQCVSGLLTVVWKWYSTNLQHWILHKETFLARLLQRKMETSKQQCLVDVRPTTATNPVTPNSIDFSSWPSNKIEVRVTQERHVSVHILIRIPQCSLDSIYSAFTCWINLHRSRSHSQGCFGSALDMLPHYQQASIRSLCFCCSKQIKGGGQRTTSSEILCLKRNRRGWCKRSLSVGT